MKIERSRELYAAVRSLAPAVSWNESKWRAYKAARVCPSNQKLWVHYAAEDLLNQTAGKINITTICALMEIDPKLYETPPLYREVETESEIIRRKLVMGGISKPDQHLIVWQIHQQGFKGETAARAAGCSRATFGRTLKQIYNIINEKYTETENETFMLGKVRLIFDGHLYDEYMEGLAKKALDSQLPTNKDEDTDWFPQYFAWLQQAKINKPIVEVWLKNFIERQASAKEREQANI